MQSTPQIAVHTLLTSALNSINRQSFLKSSYTRANNNQNNSNREWNHFQIHGLEENTSSAHGTIHTHTKTHPCPPACPHTCTRWLLCICNRYNQVRKRKLRTGTVQCSHQSLISCHCHCLPGHDTAVMAERYNVHSRYGKDNMVYCTQPLWQRQYGILHTAVMAETIWYNAHSRYGRDNTV